MLRKTPRILVFLLYLVPYLLFTLFFLLTTHEKKMDFLALVPSLKSFLIQKACINSSELNSALSCLVQENKQMALIGLAIIVLCAIYFFAHSNKKLQLHAEKFLDNLFYLLLVGPLLYASYVYLPLVWTANNPSGFFILAALSFTHVVMTSFLNRFFTRIFEP